MLKLPRWASRKLPPSETREIIRRAIAAGFIDAWGSRGGTYTVTTPRGDSWTLPAGQRLNIAHDGRAWRMV